MKKRVLEKNWHLEVSTRKKKLSFKDRILYRVEKWTGHRLFDYKNYRII
jgi:hypothetical protein